MQKILPALLCLLFSVSAYAQPTSAPPTPSQAAVDVISLFGESYTSATGLTPTTFGVNNNTAVVANEAGNEVYQFNVVDGDFQGFDLDEAIDLTAMENIHYDIWVEGTIDVGAIFNTTVSYHAGGHLTGQTTGYVHTNPIPTGQEGQWLSFDIPFNSFAPDLSTSPKDIISQLVFTFTNLTSTGPIYVDNIYFWKPPVDPAMDASLSDLQVDGATIDGFSPTELNYTVNVSSADPIPQITAATTTNMNATATITQAGAVPGQAMVEVTAEDGVTTQTYTVDFVLSISGPTTVPPAPTQAEADVISLFSDAYTSATGLTPTTFGVNNNTAAVVEAAGNDVYEFTIVDGDFQAFTLDDAIDLTTMENIHYDIWVGGTTNVGAIFNTVISYHADGHLTGQTTGYANTNPIAPGQEGQWLSFDIPFSNFAPDLAANPKDIISELVFAYTNLSDVGPIYMDNLYFWKTPTDPATDASLSDLQVDGATVEGFSPSELNYTVNVSEGAPVPQITAATTTNMNATAAITQAAAVPGQATVEVTAEDGVTMQTYTVDFILSTVGPTTAPPTPTQAEEDVISLFSDAYTSATGLTPTTFGANNNTAAVVEAAGNDVYEFTIVDGDFQAFTLDEAIDLTEMENLHYDIWVAGTTDVGAIFNTTISYHAGGHLTGQTTGYVHTNPIATGQEGQWLSFDIPFSNFAPDLAANPKDIISELVFNYTNLSDVGPIYMDNIYFWKTPNNAETDASLSDLQVDGATVGGFSPSELNYTVNVSEGAPVPQITAATTTNMNATAAITQAAAVPGQATVEVTAEDGVTMQTYTVDFILSTVGPTTAPPTPTQAEADVISLFSGAYTSATGLTPTTFGVNNNTAAVVEAAGNDVYEFTIVDGDFQAFTLDEAIDLTEMENLHYDIWVAGTTDVGAIFNTTISYHAGGHLTGQTTGYVHTNPIATGQEGQWLSFDIPFSNFAPDLAANPKDIISELVFSYTNLSDVGPIYIDNLYFWKTSTDPSTDASLSDLQVDGATVEGFSPSELNYTVNVSEGAPVPQITAATTTNMNATAAITQATAVPGQATVEVTAEDGVTMQTYTVDFTVSIVGPTTAPPTPTIPASRVISLFSEAYTSATDLTPTTFGANNNTAAVVEAAGNDVYEFTIVDGDFQGFELGNAIDLTMMDTLHYDIWVGGTTDVGAIFNTTISYHAGGHLTGQTTGYAHTNPIAAGQEGQWLSFDIPFSSFAPDLAANPKDIISELVFVYTNLSDVGPIYIDNIYFYRDVMTSTPDVSALSERIEVYPNPTQLGEVVNFSEIPALIEVFSMEGRLLRTSKTGYLQTVGLQSGTYVLKITTEAGDKAVKKLILH